MCHLCIQNLLHYASLWAWLVTLWVCGICMHSVKVSLIHCVQLVYIWTYINIWICYDSFVISYSWRHDMNYPLLMILITKIYMIYNSNFIYTWQLSDQVAVPRAWPAVGTSYPVRPWYGKDTEAPHATSQAGLFSVYRHTHLRGQQTSKHWKGDSFIGICDKNGMRDVCRV